MERRECFAGLRGSGGKPTPVVGYACLSASLVSASLVTTMFVPRWSRRTRLLGEKFILWSCHARSSPEGEECARRIVDRPAHS